MGGPVIIGGRRLGAPRDRIRFQDDQQPSRLVHMLDPLLSHPAGQQGRWWRPTRLRAGAGCSGLQIDGAGFTQVLVVEFA